MIFDRLRRWWARRGPERDVAVRVDDPMEHDAVTCREALERIYEYMDGELDDVSYDQVEEHFKICTNCYPHLRLEERFRERVCDALSAPEVPRDLRRRVLDMLASEPEGDALVE
jgi:anti-sigma factor (TIGR02949 family)